MKFDEYLAQYLYEKRILHLEGLGTFNLDKSVVLPGAGDKETSHPIEGLTFTYNIKDVTDEDLIAFLVKRLGKIEPLIRSDLESYLSSIRQFINIGNPYTIEGIGTLSKNNQGLYEFSPGTFLVIKEELPPRKERADHSHQHTHIHETSHKYVQPAKKGSGAKTFFIVLITLAVLGGIGWAAYTYLLQNKSTETTEPQAVNEPVTDTTVSRRPARATSPTDTMRYKMIFEVTGNKDRAFVRTARLKNYKIKVSVDTLVNGDSTRYRLFIPVRINVSDTARYKDSLSRFFARPVIIEPSGQ